MRTLTRIFTFITAMTISAIWMQGQGSGDLGTGYTGEMNPFRDGEIESSYLGIYPAFGLGDENTAILSTRVYSEINVWQGISVNLWFPYHFVAGELGNTNGIGDPTLGLTLAMVETPNLKVNLNVSGRLSTGEPTLSKDGRHLPMTYQVVSGTHDLMLSAMLYTGTWQFGGGYQHTGTSNSNEFDPEDWLDPIGGVYQPAAQNYPASRQLKRGDDFSARIQKNFIRPQARYLLAALPIYRFQEDSIIEDGERVEVTGSDGLSLNLQAGALFRVGKRMRLDLLASVPVVHKKVYPDGSERSFVFTTGLLYMFDVPAR